MDLRQCVAEIIGALRDTVGEHSSTTLHLCKTGGVFPGTVGAVIV